MSMTCFDDIFNDTNFLLEKIKINNLKSTYLPIYRLKFNFLKPTYQPIYQSTKLPIYLSTNLPNFQKVE